MFCLHTCIIVRLLSLTPNAMCCVRYGTFVTVDQHRTVRVGHAAGCCSIRARVCVASISTQSWRRPFAQDVASMLNKPVPRVMEAIALYLRLGFMSLVR